MIHKMHNPNRVGKVFSAILREQHAEDSEDSAISSDSELAFRRLFVRTVALVAPRTTR
jgi:hypothetical protein